MKFFIIACFLALSVGGELNVNREADAETLVTLFPPQPETLPLPDLTLSFPAALEDLIVGNVSYTNVVVTGADKLVHDLSITSILPARILFSLSAPSIALTGAHETALSLLNSLLTINGQGDFSLSITNLATSLDVKVVANLVTQKISITDFILDLDFDDLSIDFGDTKLNDQAIDWASITTVLNSCFRVDWPVINDALTKFVLEDINELIKDCTWPDLLAGNFDCLAIPKTFHFNRFQRAELPCLFSTPAPETTTGRTTPGDNNGADSKTAHIFSFLVAFALMVLIV